MVMSEVVLRNRNCRGCGVVFCVCGRCDRGQCYCSPLCRRGSSAATAPRGQSTSPTDGRSPTTASDAPARLSAAAGRGPRDGSWFPCDRFAGRDTAQAPLELCGLRSLQPMDRSVSRDSATAMPLWTATHGRQTFENIRFQMIANAISSSKESVSLSILWDRERNASN
jgi:hypothetical protein